ncbi:hypothetical protein ACVWWN_003515 [Mycobacterium sp. URHB0021]
MPVKGNFLTVVMLASEPVVRPAGYIVARTGLAVTIGWIKICKFFPMRRTAPILCLYVAAGLAKRAAEFVVDRTCH